MAPAASSLVPTTSSPTTPTSRLTASRRRFLKHHTFQGNEIVANTRRLCLMNLFLHNIGEIDGAAPTKMRMVSRVREWRSRAAAIVGLTGP